MLDAQRAYQADPNIVTRRLCQDARIVVNQTRPSFTESASIKRRELSSRERLAVVEISQPSPAPRITSPIQMVQG